MVSLVEETEDPHEEWGSDEYEEQKYTTSAVV
jgi:hypothetical protein